MVDRSTQINRRLIGATLLILFFSPKFAFGLEILTMGDSITKGTPYYSSGEGRTNGAYQIRLNDILRNQSVPSNIYNWGEGGEMTTEGVNRITSVLGSRAADLILIMEGANDVKGGISAQTVETNIRIMIQKSLQYGVTPVVGTITPNTRETRYDLWTRDVFNPRIIAVAASMGVALADQYDALRPGWESVPLNYDKLHPNWNGYQVIAETWYQAMPFPHSVTTGSAEKITAVSAVLKGSVNPNGSDIQAYFQYGTSTAYGNESAHFFITAQNDDVNISIPVAGLKPFTFYHYRLLATNRFATVYGDDQTFRTSGTLPLLLLLSE